MGLGLYTVDIQGGEVMSTKNVYEELAEMEDRDDPTGMPMTPEFLKLLRLQFTPEEARLAVQIGLTGGTLSELSEKTGIEKSKLKKILEAMADKGTMWIDPGKKDPIYRVVGMAAPGLVETGIWGNIRFPYSVELGKALHRIIYDWGKERLCKMGFPFAPVWAALSALPDDALPSENLAEAIKEAGHWSVSACPCRLSAWLATPGEHCDHILETCIHTGDVSHWAVEHGMARELTYDEAIELLRKCNDDGLVHTLNIQNCICNCCNDCCPQLVGQLKHGAQILIPSPFVAHVDEEMCSACKVCADRCPMGAIEVDEFAKVKGDLCIGCGVCVPTCSTQSMSLVRRPAAQ